MNHQACGGRLGMAKLSWLGDRSKYSFFNHIIKGTFNLFLELYGYLLHRHVGQGDRRVGPDGIGSRHVAYGVKGVRGRLASGK